MSAVAAVLARPHVLDGAVEVIACANCPEPVTACLAPACTAYRHVHVRSRLHRCGNGVSYAYPVIQAGGTVNAHTRDFHVGDILSVTTGHLVSPRHMDGIYDVLNWMTGDNLFTHQPPPAMDECAPSLREQFPDLAAIECPEGLAGEEPVREWVARQVAAHGETRAVRPLAEGLHARIDPFAELRSMAPGKPVVAVVVPDGEPS